MHFALWCKVSFAQVKDQLSPAEKNLDDADTMMKPMTSQLRALKNLLENAQQKAQGARDSSEDAEREAAIGSNVRGSRFLPENLDHELLPTSNSHSNLF